MFSGSKYEQSEEETSMTNSSSKILMGSNSNGSNFKLGGSSNLNLYPAISLDEESSDSEDEEMLQEED